MGASGSKAGRGHRSLNCRTATVVEFENATDRPVCTVWLGYNGTARRYFTLQPGQRVRQPTFTAHPWTFGPGDDSDSSSSSSSTPLVVDDQTVFYTPPLPAGDAPLPVRARITTAVPLGWTPATHAHFPPAFRAQAAALLRCHRRLASSSGATAPGGDAVQQGCPQWLRRLGCTLSAAQAKSSCAAADVPVAGARGEARCQLGHLPKELLLEVLAAAAPFVSFVVKPSVPLDATLEELSLEARSSLFRQPSSGEEAPPAAPAAAL
ncbi:von Hippel-Lindau disease tumor suppressor [Micractinium conductrix]|uniref:von Hippel-Lindau disease tumor suppressor n=1 Tax=Micractinium conductrix TaxID=554055 RepID=A0A2P6VPJ9_9CHLO|nr:von Hippel-Lindau disease tumor suppressor [Micractinium conductrix]|eukprot:PSC75987.1 von Hippel-Lindau disease tumor suppressor [Micractinium conductrix]